MAEQQQKMLTNHFCPGGRYTQQDPLQQLITLKILRLRMNICTGRTLRVTADMAAFIKLSLNLLVSQDHFKPMKTTMLNMHNQLPQTTITSSSRVTSSEMLLKTSTPNFSSKRRTALVTSLASMSAPLTI